MEFYLAMMSMYCRYGEFQFPTGWNSTRQLVLRYIDFFEFQFPTGWNSTKIQKNIYQTWKVSIPNGMEFYNFVLFPILVEQGFNSQRDGILRSYEIKVVGV